MPIPSALRRAYKAVFYRQRKSNDLHPTASPVVAAVARLAATILVLASAGFGAVYAWSTGSEHGPVLAALSVLMALGLEASKPLAVAYALTSFRSLALFRGTCLAALAAVAITYSLTAELTLMAGTRGDVVASRDATLKASRDAEGDAQRARDRYDAAKAQLATLAPARPAGEIAAEIAALKHDRLYARSKQCTEASRPESREHCAKIERLAGEQARAERRAELEAVLAAPLPVATTAAPGAHVKAADPGATALATYLATLGIVIKVDVLSEWLALVPVLALEVGSAFAGVLVQATSQQTARRQPERPQESVTDQPGTAQLVHPEPAANTDDVAARERVKAAILNQLEKRGGSVASSERGLAALIGASRPTVRRAINGLVLAGIVAAEATRNGTVLRLLS